MTAARFVFALTACWHALAVWHFGVYPERTLKRTTTERPPNAFAVELFRFLAGLNLACVVLGVVACVWTEATRAAAVTLMVANLTQAMQDERVRRLGLAKGPMFWTIFAGDVGFTVANGVIVATSFF